MTYHFQIKMKDGSTGECKIISASYLLAVQQMVTACGENNIKGFLRTVQMKMIIMTIEADDKKVHIGEYLLTELDVALADMFRTKDRHDIKKITLEIKNV